MVGQPVRNEHGPGARELARQAVRAQVAEMAIDLFLTKGYEQTTIDDVCAVAGISRSTFFRYFPSKEDVFLNETAGALDELAAALRQRPDDESPWDALRNAMGPLVAHYATRNARARQLADLARTTPALATLNQDKYGRTQRLLGPEIARRLGADPDDPTDPRPGALVATAMACLEAAVASWIAGGGTRELADMLRYAMDAVHPG